MKPREIKAAAYRIAEEYQGNLTVRQLYYQFVSRGLTGSGQNVYKQIVRAVTDARMEGSFPFGWIVDRTRTANPSDQLVNLDDVDDALEEARQTIFELPEMHLGRSRWWGQSRYVIVGVEKEALAGVFERPCRDLGVGLFVFRGYSSVSALYQLVQHLAEAAEYPWIEQVEILYFGDHDPNGWEIPRVAERTITQISEVAGLAIPPVIWHRVALNMGQIEEFDPPPFEAKMSSSRYDAYVREHGTEEAWELDALPPDALQKLIRQQVVMRFNRAISAMNYEDIRRVRGEMRRCMQRPEWMAEALGVDDE